MEAAPVAPAAPVVPAEPEVAAPPPAPVAPVKVAPAAPVAPVVPKKPAAPVAPVKPAAPAAPAVAEGAVAPLAGFQGGEVAEHAMMLQDDVKVAVKQKKDPIAAPPLKAGLSEAKEYLGDIVWPTLAELEVPADFKAANEEWYKQGMNRQRQKDRYFQLNTHHNT